MKQLTIYSANGCPSCVAAAQLLDRKGIPYNIVKVDEDAEAKAFFQKEGHRTVPQIYLGDKLFVAGGFTALVKMDEEAFQQQFEKFAS